MIDTFDVISNKYESNRIKNNQKIVHMALIKSMCQLKLLLLISNINS